MLGTAPAMRVNQFFLNVASDRPGRLFRYYRDTLGLEVADFMGQAVRAGGAVLAFDARGDVRGGAREPQRYLISLVVDDLAVEQARIEAQGVSFIRRKGHQPSGGRISTLLDPDGNYVQLVEYACEGME